jgi:predicted ATPase
VAPTLPLPLTPLYGREADVARLRALLDEGARFITLFGPGGVGKTRLALRLGELHQERAWLIDMLPARAPGDVCDAVGATLGVPVRSNTALEDVGAAIAARSPALFILDNCEHVASSVADALASWLALAPRACFVLTSRELIRVPGERAFEVEPLPEERALALFVGRARLTRADYVLGPANEGYARAIVRKLEGLPLAIELAAGRMGVLGERELLARLEHPLDVLGTRARGVGERQRTVRAAVDWSWRLLLPWEKSALTQCAVFRGAFSLQAAEAVIDVSSFAGAPPPVDVVQVLREKSLLRAFQPPGLAGEVRFALYETIRDYACEKSEGDASVATAAARHQRYFVTRAREASDAPLLAVALEIDDFSAAHARALAAPRGTGATEALSLALYLEPALAAQGAFVTLVRLIDGGLAAPAAVPPALHARALVARAAARQITGPASAIRGDLERGLELALAAGDRAVLGRAAAAMGTLEVVQHHPARARAELDRALAAFRDVGDVAGEVLALRHLGILAQNEGRIEEARERFDAARARARQTGDAHAEALATANLGQLLFTSGAPAASLELHERAIVELSAVGDLRQVANVVGHTAMVLQELGRHEEAKARYENALALHRGFVDRLHLGIYVGHAGTLAHELGDLSRARVRYEEALALLEETGLRAYEGRFLALLGALEAAELRLVAAERAFVTAEEHLAEAPGMLSAVAIHRGHLDLCAAHNADARGDDATAELRRAKAADRLAAAGPQNADTRLARRLLERALSHAPLPRARALVIGPDARWFRVPGGARVEIQRQRALRNVLLALARERARAPGRALDVDALLRRGWPGERVSKAAATNRVQVVISKLRGLGLRDALVRTDDGYVLDVPVFLEEQASR